MSADAGPVVRHPALGALLRERPTLADLDAQLALLERFGCLTLPALPNGLYSAVAAASPGTEYTGYHHTWVRDTVHVAAAAWDAGDLESVSRTAASLLRWFVVQGPRFEAVIDGSADRDVPNERPHIRFRGDTLEELGVYWPHIQNDALGYGLWFLCRAILSGLLEPDAEGLAALARFPTYLAALPYWEDADSGHWEEQRKVCCSSVGAVVAGLTALRGLVGAWSRRGDPRAAGLDGGQDLAALIAAGRERLARTLPWESIDPLDPSRNRRADGALLFLIHPLRVVDRSAADAILALVRDELTGPYGVRRYVGDSYWMADYKRLFDQDTRTTGFRDVDERDAHLQAGSEAQWCLFDPVLSTIHGWRFLESGDPAELDRQVHHWNRALGQITGPDCPLGEGLCPEAYYLADSRHPDTWIANDSTPLLWTQANLLVASLALRRSLEHSA